MMPCKIVNFILHFYEKYCSSIILKKMMTHCVFSTSIIENQTCSFANIHCLVIGIFSEFVSYLFYVSIILIIESENKKSSYGTVNLFCPSLLIKNNIQPNSTDTLQLILQDTCKKYKN
mmetsp:Transcript_33902/g.78284  ORF Transcript_33902/g.78284 Transcript_33902/m.78284 type:complete len:118 (-) Transcript_33902:1606-1959(-)